jgi:hypothetical protein
VFQVIFVVELDCETSKGEEVMGGNKNEPLLTDAEKAELDEILAQANADEPDVQGRAYATKSPIPPEIEVFEDEKLTKEQLQEKIRAAAAAGRVGFQCSFCDQLIEDSVTALLLVGNWDRPEEEQKAMQSFCHVDCILDALVQARKGHGLNAESAAAVIPRVTQ